MLASRLLDLERRLDQADDEAATALWAEFYVALDLWLKLRMPTPTERPITKAELASRFARERAQS